MSHNPASPFNLSSSWSASSPYGADQFPQRWISVSSAADPTYPSLRYATATPPAGCGVMGQMTVIGDNSGSRTSYYAQNDATATADELTGQKFDAPEQNYNAGVDEAIAATSSAEPFQAWPRRLRSSGFVCSTHSRLMLFAVEAT